MRFLNIFKQALLEIGDTVSTPPGLTMHMNRLEESICKFTYDGDEYSVRISIPVIDDMDESAVKMALGIDFGVGDLDGNSFSLTNKNQPLKIMSYIIGTLSEWLTRYHQKYYPNGVLNIIYIKYDPKSEEDEEYGDNGNKRDRVYRMFIEKFAKRLNSSVRFTDHRFGINAIFNPPLQIK